MEKKSKYILRFANGTIVTTNHSNLLQAQKWGHKEASRTKTFLVSVNESN
jgi:hypothetical protein